MKKLLALIVVFYATAALAQQDDTPPPAPSGKPPAHAKSKAPKGPQGPPKSLAEKLLACLDIEDESKERLDCYDAAIPPKPRPKSVPANGVMDCRYVKEEDERLKCFNGFAEKIPKFSSR